MNPISLTNPQVIQTSSKGPETPGAREKDLWNVSKRFEAMFLASMYKAMRKTVPENELIQQSPGRKIFTEMLDWEFASRHSGSGGKTASNSVAAMVYRDLQTRVKAGQDIPRLPNAIPDQAITAGTTKNRFQVLNETQRESLFQKASHKTGVPLNLLKSVGLHESAFNPNAVSPAGAKGLMQLMDSTASDMGVQNVFDPEQNILGGALYLKGLLKRYNGDLKKTLAGYNAGPGTVDRYNGIPPYPETINYVEKVLSTKNRLDAGNNKEGLHGSKKGLSP